MTEYDNIPSIPRKLYFFLFVLENLTEIFLYLVWSWSLIFPIRKPSMSTSHINNRLVA